MNKNIFTDTKEELEILYREIYLAKCQYIIFEKLYDNLLNNNPNDKLLITKKGIFDAVEYSVLLKLAKIYDIDKSRQSITLYHMLNKIQCEKELNKNDEKIKKYVKEKLENLQNDEIIRNIKVFRDKNIAHLDKDYKIGLKGIHKECDLTFNDIKILLNKAYEIIKILFKLVLSIDYGNDKDFEILQLEMEYCDKELYYNI